MTGRPLVAVMVSVPLVGEAIRSALDFADVRSFTGQRDTAGLLRWLRPDVVVVDSESDAIEAAEYAIENDLSVLHVCVHERSLPLFRRGMWEPVGNGEGPTPEAIHNVVAGILFARGGPIS